jgi:hypothetical protein
VYDDPDILIETDGTGALLARLTPMATGSTSRSP